MKVVSSLALVTLCFASFGARADTAAEHLVLQLQDVDYKIQQISYLTCDLDADARTGDCLDQVAIEMRDGRKISKRISWYSAGLLNRARSSFSSEGSAVVTGNREGGLCRMLAPRERTTLQSTLASAELSTVLGYDGCMMRQFLRPASDAAYANAVKARELLLLLAYETLLNTPAN